MPFKRLTANNWDEPDETNKHFVRISPVAGVVEMNGNDWAYVFTGSGKGFGGVGRSYVAWLLRMSCLLS